MSGQPWEQLQHLIVTWGWWLCLRDSSRLFLFSCDGFSRVLAAVSPGQQACVLTLCVLSFCVSLLLYLFCAPLSWILGNSVWKEHRVCWGVLIGVSLENSLGLSSQSSPSPLWFQVTQECLMRPSVTSLHGVCPPPRGPAQVSAWFPCIPLCRGPAHRDLSH